MVNISPHTASSVPPSLPSVPLHPLGDPDTAPHALQALAFNLVGLLLGVGTLIIGGLQLRKMYVVRKRKKEEQARSEERRGSTVDLRGEAESGAEEIEML